MGSSADRLQFRVRSMPPSGAHPAAAPRAVQPYRKRGLASPPTPCRLVSGGAATGAARACCRRHVHVRAGKGGGPEHPGSAIRQAVSLSPVTGRASRSEDRSVRHDVLCSAGSFRFRLRWWSLQPGVPPVSQGPLACNSRAPRMSPCALRSIIRPVTSPKHRAALTIRRISAGAVVRRLDAGSVSYPPRRSREQDGPFPGVASPSRQLRFPEGTSTCRSVASL
jgi:hypothetical protein